MAVDFVSRLDVVGVRRRYLMDDGEAEAETEADDGEVVDAGGLLGSLDSDVELAPMPYLLTYGDVDVLVVAGGSRLMLRYVPPEYEGRYDAGDDIVP